MIHEDERRILEEWAEGKVITAKADCTLGNHYHKIKTEKFILVEGFASMTTWSTGKTGNTRQMEIGKVYTVKPFTWHGFNLMDGSVMIGLCSEKYNPNDEYQD